MSGTKSKEDLLFRVSVPSGSVWAYDTMGWGDMSMSSVTKYQSPFMRRHSELSWVLLQKAETSFTQVPTDFPLKIMHVFDSVLLRGAFSAGVTEIRVEENFGTYPDNFGPQGDNPLSITVVHFGERMNFSDPNDDLFMALKELIGSFPQSEYVIEINDGRRATSYKQVSGSETCGEPTIQQSVDANNWTKVTIRPDHHIFNIAYDGLAIGRTIWKRCVDVAGTLDHLNVSLSGANLNINGFIDYVGWYPRFSLEKRSHAPERIHEEVIRQEDKWEICIGRSHGEFEHISFVNGLPTHKGGTHVELVKKTLVHYAGEVQDKFGLSCDLNDICIFINFVTPNMPNLSSENDCFLAEFEAGYELKFSEEFCEKFAEILKELGPIPLSRNIPNLNDASMAGGRLSDKCCLILTEGESAKKFAVTGYDYIDKQFYGVLSIRGKIQNAKKKASSVLQNEAIKNIVASLGLEKGVCYTSVKKLRYGRLILMMDQDHDGSHIKGLIINLLHTLWPSLLKIEFLFQFVTPVIKVKVQMPRSNHEFYSIPEFDTWASKQDNSDDRNRIVSYYKGLASHDSADAKRYMSDMGHHLKSFKYSGPHDFNVIDLAFSEDRVHDRKRWILSFEDGTFVDQNPESISYSDFFNKEYILYSIGDIRRSIPSMVDGLKPSQRKALFSALLNDELHVEKIDSFAGGVMKQYEYHHGQSNLSDTIIGMAHTYVGTNNINPFIPKGIFGSRREASEPNAASRYLSVILNPVMRDIFLKDDDVLLSHLVEDGKEVEPEWLLPIIPMSLVNGGEGIATGWSTVITNYNPLEIIANLKCILTGQKPTPLVPWFNRFKGNVEVRGGYEASYKISGAFHVIRPGKVEIIEFPVGTKFDKYKSELDKLVTDGSIESYCEDHKEDDIKFVVDFTDEQFKFAERQGLLKFFKLINYISTDNMHLVDEKGLVTKYSSPDEILSSFYAYRLPFYEKRKSLLLEQYAQKISKLKNQIRYIEEFNKGKFAFNKKQRMDQLLDRGYARFPDDDSFNYINLLTQDELDEGRIPALKSECDSLVELHEKVEGLSASQFWIADLDALEKRIQLFYEGKLIEDPELHRNKRQRIK